MFEIGEEPQGHPSTAFRGLRQCERSTRAQNDCAQARDGEEYGRDGHGRPVEKHIVTSRIPVLAPRRMPTYFVVACLILVCSPALIMGRTFKETIVSTNNWVFLDKFVYDATGEGQFEYSIQVDPISDGSVGDEVYTCTQSTVSNGDSNGTSGTVQFDNCKTIKKATTYLLFYNDNPEADYSWANMIEDETLTCESRFHVAEQPVPLTKSIMNSGQLKLTKAARPRFWYVVLADCSSLRLQAKVELKFLNKGWEEKTMTYHFGADEQGLYEMTIFFFGMYGLGSIMMALMVKNFITSNVMHEIHWIMVAAYMSFTLAHMLRLIHFVKFAQDGIGTEWVTIFARCFEVVGFLTFVNVLLLIARGWTITTNKLSRKSENAFFTTCLILIYVILFFSDVLRDPASASYLYDTWPGYLFLTMNIFLMGVFVSLIRRTYVFEKRIVKRAFYRRFGFVFSMWFLQVPLLVAVARFLEPWERAKVLFGCEHCFQLLAFLLFPCLQKPKTAFEVYGATDGNYDARIPSIARQQRVQPAGIELPQAQVSGLLPGGLPPVNPNMTADLSQAERAGRTASRSAAGAGTGEGVLES